MASEKVMRVLFFRPKSVQGRIALNADALSLGESRQPAPIGHEWRSYSSKTSPATKPSPPQFASVIPSTNSPTTPSLR